MSVHSCPCCNATTTRWLEGCSDRAQVDYYRCEECAHVWAVAKDGSGRITHVTPRVSPAHRDTEGTERRRPVLSRY
jgi:hypothetical protein